jgi:hypothetical protein
MGWGSYEGGRPKLSDEHKRKNKQFRISDKEMEYLGNPNTTEIRKRLMKLKAIEEFCELADSKGVQVIPDECLDRIGRYDKTDAYYYHMFYSTNYKKLMAITDQRFRKDGDHASTWEQMLNGFGEIRNDCEATLEQEKSG